MTSELKMERAYLLASEKYEGFDEIEPEIQHYLAYDFYIDLCYEEEAAYWAPTLAAMERMKKEEQFEDPTSLYEWQAGEVPDRD